MMIALMVSLYYNVIVSLTIFYFFASFSSKLPWATCDGWWVKGPCVDKEHHWGKSMGCSIIGSVHKFSHYIYDSPGHLLVCIVGVGGGGGKEVIGGDQVF